MNSAFGKTGVTDRRYSLLIFDLARAQEWFFESVRLTSAALGLPTRSAAQSMLLGHVAMGEHRPARLARSIGMSRQAISVLIAQLAQEGVLRTQTDPDDARALWVDFTPAHLPERDAAARILQELERRVGQIIGDDRLAVLRSSLRMDWGTPLQLDAAALGLEPLAKRLRSRRSRK